MTRRHAAKAAFALSTAVPALCTAAPSFAADRTVDALTTDTAHPEASDGATSGTDDTIVVTGSTTRSATAIEGVEIQKLLPGINPLKAIQTLPGVTFITADPWGNNEQNTSLFIHGFSAGQLGYTLDDVPLGDQNYGNYNGLSPQRAIISENVGRVTVSTGAAELRVASTSNLGGAIETVSSDPKPRFGVSVAQTLGSYGAARTYVRVDSGEFGNGNSLYLSGIRQRARAWDFEGRQGGYQANAKFVHDDAARRLVAYVTYSQKDEPNEDSTTRYRNPANAAQAFQPYIRPFFYPDFSSAVAYLDANGAVPAIAAVNYRNYYSAAQRTDYLAYIKDTEKLSDNVTFSVQGYYHNNDGAGIVAGPITVASLPTLFALYFPGQNLKLATGNSGYAIRTTEYRIDRGGAIAQLNVQLGRHAIEAGAWYEHNSSAAYRRWYALDVTRPQDYSPYIRPSNPLFTQYGSEIRNNVIQLHLQDTWKPVDRLTIEAGFKSSLQYANGYFTVQPIVGSLPGSASALPQGKITTERWFLPSVGAKWEFTDNEQLYANAQKNLRQFQTYGAGGGAAPWSVGSQQAFDFIRDNVKPETSWTYEVGLRSRHTFGGPFLNAIEAQVNYYHVDFSNRLLEIVASVGGIAGGSIAGGTPSLFNVGSVKTNGVDAAITLRLMRHLTLYNALSYNTSVYQSDYSAAARGATGTRIGGFAVVGGVVPTGGKQVPGSPKWLNKTVATIDAGPIELQFVGDYVGRRFATFANDASVPSFFLGSARVGVKLPVEGTVFHRADFSVNVTNLFQERGVSTVAVGSATNTYNTYPIAPRQVFATLGLEF